jgi:fibronectin-binding autotransporter adhesin
VVDNLSAFFPPIANSSAAADALTFNQTSQNLTYAAAISGSGAVTKSGTSTLTLSGANTHTGATTVGAGTLLVTGSTAAGSAVAVASSSTLGGNGTIAGTITVANGGLLTPGTGGTTIATLTTGPVVFNASSTYAVDLDGTTPSFDRITSSGAVACNGTLTIASLANAALNNTYTIASGTSIGGTFTGLANNALFVYAGRLFRIAYGATTVTLTDVAPVIAGRQTRDVDGNGRIDRIRLTFDQNLNDDFSGLTVTVAGYTVTGFSTGTANDAVVDVLLTESGAADSGATPAVRITANTSLKDVAATVLVQTEGLGTAASDGAAPVLLSAAFNDLDANGVDAGDTLVLTFSETVASAAMVPAELGLPVTNDTLGGATIANQSGLATITVVLAGSPRLTPGGTYSSAVTGDAKPSGIFLASAAHLSDLATTPNAAATGNAAGAVDVGTTPSTLIRIEWNDTHDTVAKTWALGAIDLAAVSASGTYTILNAGYSSVSLSATSSDSAAWTVQGAGGADAFAMKANADANPDYELTLSTTAAPIPTVMRSGSLFDFSLQFSAPTSSTTSASQTVVVTNTASQY